MIDTRPLESLSPEERARLGSEIRKNLGLPPDASDWIVIAILTILVSRMFDRHERLIRKANRLFYLLLTLCICEERRVHAANERALAAEQWADAVSNEAAEMLERCLR